ncbi:MAG: lysoplasmalogenase [Acidimicrobiia bacterium]
MLGAALLVTTALAAALDWWSVHAGRRDVERWAKPLTMLLLVAVAATWGDGTGDVRAWLVVGACLGVVGDVALLDDGETAFLVGLSSFAAGHLAYAVAAVRTGFDPAWALPGVVAMVVLLGFRFVTRTMVGARREGGTALAGAVVVYATVISAMVVTSWATEAVVAGIGGTLFAVSDWVLGHRRFAGPLPGGRLAVMVPYHLGQALLLIGLATGPAT